MDKIDWDEYYIDKDDWGRRTVTHEVPGCFEEYEIFGLQDAIDWALEHNKTCPKY